MQNLGGPSSLIGRSVAISIEGEDAPRACCTVGRAPNPNAPPKPEPQPAYHPSQGHYHGGYGYGYQRPNYYGGYGGGYPQYPQYGGYQGGYYGNRGQQGRGYYY
jgi:peptide chain release factor subunit 3